MLAGIWPGLVIAWLFARVTPLLEEFPVPFSQKLFSMSVASKLPLLAVKSVWREPQALAAPVL